MNELIIRDGNNIMLDVDTASRLAKYEEAIKSIKEAEDAIKAKLLAEMEKLGVVKIDSEYVTISYIAPTDREKFDAKSFKAEYKDLYDEYVTMIPVKASLRVRVK